MDTFLLAGLIPAIGNAATQSIASTPSVFNDISVSDQVSFTVCRVPCDHKMIRILSISFFSLFIFFQSAIQQAHAARATLLYDIDGDDNVTALVDGLLLRYSFGFRGATLTEGAVSNKSTRTTAQIEAYINDNLSKFDLDGNNQVRPLTDGLLLVRALFGFTGDTLTSGILGDGATRYNRRSNYYLP